MISVKWVLKGLSDVIAPIIEMVVTQSVNLLMQEFWDRNPDDAKLTAITLYPVVDTKLENLVEKTETKLDDAGVIGIKKGLEQFAGGHGIELPNLDDD